MGWCDESGEHEGWVQPIFDDGEEGTGTTNATGVIFDCYTPQERVRPYAQITHLRMVCECGWKGTTRAIADLPAEHVDPKWNEPTDDGEEADFLPEWQAHVAPFNAVHQLAVLADQVRVLDDRINETVTLARQSGASWSMIGGELGVTKQAAQQRFGA